jgi:FlaA1/EpsC-like NDP-sugar epimerase
MINSLKHRIIQIFRNHSLPRWFVLLIDISAVFFTFLFSYLLRFNLEIHTFSLKTAFVQALIVCASYLVFMLIFKSYAGLIRQTTVKDTFIIAVTNTTALVLLLVVTLLVRQVNMDSIFNVPLSIMMIHYGAVTVALIFFRIFIKMFYVFVSIPVSSKKMY